MRLKTYIKENKLKTPNTSYEAIYFIAENCKPFLKESQLEPFWRGTDSTNKDFAIKKPRKRRKPRDTAPIISKMINDYIAKKIGWRPRTQGLFTTSDWYKAAGFGSNIYCVFPIGKFKYMWIKDMEDTIIIQNELLEIVSEHPDFTRTNNWEEDMEFKDKLKSGDVTLTPKEKKIFRESLKNIFNDFTIKTNDLHKARIEEVTFLCDSYLSVHEDRYREMLDILGKNKSLKLLIRNTL